MEAIGIYPTKAEQQNQARKHQNIEDSAPNLNPWDIRNLAEYVTGYRVEKDWIKCKCPAHDGVSDNSLHISVDSAGFRCWAGCDNKAVYAAVKEAAVTLGYQPSDEQIAAHEEMCKLKQEAVNTAVTAAETKLVKVYAQLLDAQAAVPTLKATYERLRLEYNGIKPSKANAEIRVVAKVVRDDAKESWVKAKAEVKRLTLLLKCDREALKAAREDVVKAGKAVHRKKVKEWQEWANRLDLEPTMTTSDRFDFGELPEEPGLILVEGRMSMGKTSRQLKGFRNCQAKRFPEGKVIMPVPRNVLGRANVLDLGGVYHEAFENPALLNDQIWLAMAFDSIWKIDINKLTAGSLLIIDEVTAGLLHLLLSDTLKRDGKRILAIKRFETIIKRVYELGGWVIASVDGLVNPEINYLRSIMGKDVPYIFNKSTAKPNPVDITIVSEASMILEQVVQHFAQHPNDPITVMSDSQEELRRITLHLTKHGILTEDQVTVFDSKTSAEQWAKTQSILKG